MARSLLRAMQRSSQALNTGAVHNLPLLPPRIVVARTSSVQTTAPGQTGLKRTWQIRMLYDGDCPLCMKEVDFLKSRDAGKGNIDFVDIASPSYDPADNLGITFEQAMERIHAITADNRVVTDVEVFRRLYEAVGLGWVYAVTSVPAIERAANVVYGVWAKYRTQLTGREALGVILTRRQQALKNQGVVPGTQCGDEDAACDIPSRGGSAARSPSPPPPQPPTPPSASPPPPATQPASTTPGHTSRGTPSPPPGANCGDEDAACEIPLRR